MDIKDDNYFDLFELEKNKANLNLTAGRSVVCVDRKGDGEMVFMLQITEDQQGFTRLKMNLSKIKLRI